MTMINAKVSFQFVGTPPIPRLDKAATVFKFVEPNIDYAREVRRRVSPDALFIGRWYDRQQRLDTPRVRAQEWCSKHFARMNELCVTSGPWAFEGYNEVAGGDPPAFEQAMAYCEFEMERVSWMDYNGYRAVVLNTSVGRPAFEEWKCYDPLLQQMRQSRMRHLVGLHDAYWTTRQDLENRFHVFRYWMNEVAAHLEGLQVALTEGGLEHIEDNGLPRDQWGEAGWQQSVPPEEFCSQLDHLGQLAALDENLVGVTLFQYGSTDPQYAAFDLSPILSRLAEEHEAFGGVVTPAPKEPLPEDEPQATLAKITYWSEEELRLLEALVAAGTIRADSRVMQVARGLVKLNIRARDGG